MIKGQGNCWRSVVIVIPVLLLCFGSFAWVLADPAQAVFSSAPQQKYLNARAVAYSPSQKLIPVNAVSHGSGLGVFTVSSHLPDMRSVKDVHTKKEMFFSFLLPLVEQENDRLHTVRQRLIFIQDHMRWHRPLNEDDQVWLALVSQEFKLELDNPSHPDFWRGLLMRVDEVPENLVLVQAANESAWGTSRFAREGNNLFGQWCFYPDCGLVPRNRPDGATYQVAQFSSVGESVRSYMHNLNTGRSYVLLRDVRARMRDENQEPDASEMAAGLISYSERGLAYVEEIRSMIRHNDTVIASVKTRTDS